ncbi:MULTISPECIES: tyrosine-type recombinase/integrase [unclassified Agrobacterium]|uniref:tyrosine-type recombinase/integrase n=1 Tax=unclassified Agrobacterium TaxID=2632611 RepID=UPI000361D671|nr:MULTISPECIES: tyrosine-type recombinase/integrase [unclassified Agrobacterium]
MSTKLGAIQGEQFVSGINEENCIAYRKGKALNTVRRQLENLRAIVNFAELKGKLDKGGRVLDYALPPKPKARFQYYTRDEVAKLVWTAYKRKNDVMGCGAGHKTSVHIARFILTAVYTGTRAERIEEASFDREDGRPWIDLERGIFFRKYDGEVTPTNKRADPVRIPKPLLEHMKRWKKGKPGKQGARYLIEYQGRPVTTRKGFYSLKMEVFEEIRAKVLNRHTLRHTCATWLMQAGVSIALVAKYLSTTEKIIEEVYGQFHPDFQAEADHAFSRGKAGRGKDGRQKAA